VTVVVEKTLYGFWEVLSSNFDYRKKDARTLTFEVPVEADATVVVAFTVRFTMR
jgi:hypothetical protein